MEKPLAIKLRPTKLNEIIGQDHLTSNGAPLYNLVHNGKVFSMILYGEPGTGKTSIANVIAENTKNKYRFLNAVTSNNNH